MKPIPSRIATVGIACGLVVGLACAAPGQPSRADRRNAGQAVEGRRTMSTMSLSCPAFAAGQPIPARFTINGRDISPPLVIAGAPAGTKSFVLIVDDPDAPMGTWVHWVVWNIPATTRQIPEGELPAGAVEGRNSWGRTSYGGPAPPSGTHRYFFKLYALDTVLDLPRTAAKADVLKAIDGHILAHAELMGTYTHR